MIAVYYFSGSGKSRAVAKHLARELAAEAIEISSSTPSPAENIETAVIVFPVYCQNIPAPILPFLKKLKTPKAALIATYGGIATGNVIREAASLIGSEVTAWAYVRTGHSYLTDSKDFDEAELTDAIENIKLGTPRKVKRMAKNPLADFFPAWRSRRGVTIRRLDNCTLCGRCTERCPMHAIRDGVPNDKCIRCLRCVSECPNSALDFSLSATMYFYLNK